MPHPICLVRRFNMQLIKKEFIDASKLSGREYLVSLLREAQKSGLVLPESAVRIQKEGMDIVADLAMDFTDGLSSSIRIEQAQEFVLSVFYTAGLALKACPSPDEAAFRLASEPLRTLYDEGTKIIKKKLVTARMLHGQVSKNIFAVKNEFYASTIIDGIRGFFKLYNPKFGTHETHITADYPTFLPVNDLTGIEFIEKYLERIDIENRFCLCFDSTAASEMLCRRFGEEHETLVLNIFEQVLAEALRCAVSGTPVKGLACDTCVLNDMLSNLTQTQLSDKLHAALSAVLSELQASGPHCTITPGVIEYVKSGLPIIYNTLCPL